MPEEPEPHRARPRDDLTLRDFLAVDRTVLANERTFLAYVRTALAFLVVGFSFIKFFAYPLVAGAGYGLVVVAAVFLVLGVKRFLVMKNQIRAEQGQESSRDV